MNHSEYDEKYEKAVIQSYRLRQQEQYFNKLKLKKDIIQTKVEQRLKQGEIARIENGFLLTNNNKLVLIHSQEDLNEKDQNNVLPFKSKKQSELTQQEIEDFEFDNKFSANFYTSLLGLFLLFLCLFFMFSPLTNN